jgi:AcrR family transcriptional regulator
VGGLAPEVQPDGGGRVALLEAGRGGVPDIQRARIMTAFVEVTRERGAPRVTVAHVVARSGVSRRTFYEMFEDREACFLAVFDEAIERAATRVLPAFEAAKGWRAQIRAGLMALLGFLDDEPGLGALCVVDTLGAGPAVLECRAEVVRILVDDGGEESMLALLSALMGMVVLPYLGSAAAGRETVRPAPKARRRMERPASNPLEGLHMRLTYRTVRVLAAIAAVPGASNREVADAAGIQDQGQISKLLVRLDRIGLIVNGAEAQGRGEPNAWRLTDRGHDVEHAIRAQTAPLAG